MTRRAHNFSAGPAALPLPVLQQAQQELVDFGGRGMSLLEMSHRSPLYEEVHQQAIERLREILEIPSDYTVLLMQGGARLQFSVLAMNLLGQNEGLYINTGVWSTGAIEEAAKVGQVREVWSGRDTQFNHVPAPNMIQLPEHGAYLHYTSNNTIYGTEYGYTPASGGLPLVCDMSSDILSRPVDVSKFGLIYAGAQKNMGPAGVTVVIIRNDLLGRSPQAIPDTLSYARMAEKNSMLNTPPVFAIYMLGLVVQHWLDQGGLEAVEQRNRRKAELLYQAIDESEGFYRGHAQVESRSRMNVTFRLPQAEIEAKFVAESEEAGLVGLKGHRLVGGLRASLYNAVPLQSVEALVEFMRAFARRHR